MHILKWKVEKNSTFDCRVENIFNSCGICVMKYVEFIILKMNMLHICRIAKGRITVWDNDEMFQYDEFNIFHHTYAAWVENIFNSTVKKLSFFQLFISICAFRLHRAIVPALKKHFLHSEDFWSSIKSIFFGQVAFFCYFSGIFWFCGGIFTHMLSIHLPPQK